jgi:hypothetical protein
MVHTEGPMPYMRVHLPADLYERVKTRGLPASELLEKAVRAELSRLESLAGIDRYVADLVAEVGPPTAAQRTRAAAVARDDLPVRRVDHHARHSRYELEMNDSDFQQLLASVKEAGRIKRGEQEPARRFEVKAEDVKAIPTIAWVIL